MSIDELFRDPFGTICGVRVGTEDCQLAHRLPRTRPIGEALRACRGKPFRRRALETASKWMLEHFERSDGLGAIYPAMMNAVFALLAWAYCRTTRSAARAIDALAALEIEEADTIRVQPAFRRSGTPRSPWSRLKRLEFRRIIQPSSERPTGCSTVRSSAPGDWQQNNSGYSTWWLGVRVPNDFYPDLDDTAFVLLALAGVAHPDRDRMTYAFDRGLTWLIAMQSRDGGWGHSIGTTISGR